MQSCVHFFFFFCPPDRPTFKRGRAMGNETFYGDGLSQKKKLYVPYGSLNFIRLLRVVITPAEKKTTRSNRMNFRLRWVPLPFSPSFGFCSSFLVWFCFLWNWPPLWNIELPSGSNKNFNFIPWLTTFFLHWSNVTSNNPYRAWMYLGLILNRSVTFLSVSLVRITSKSPRVGLFNITPSLQVNLSAVAFSEVVNSLNWDGWQ